MTYLIIAAAIAAVAGFIPLPASAHCPLCTAGAGILAATAVSLGVDPMAVGVFIGAFAVAVGLWGARLLKNRYFSWQGPAIAVASFLLTVLPLTALFDTQTAFSVFIAGGYGSPLNRTYLVNQFAAGAVIGGLLLAAAPSTSSALARATGRRLPYQGMAVTFGLLIVSSLVIQLLA